MRTPTGAVFLDRDGVINEVVYRDARPASPSSLAEFRFIDGVADSLWRLRDGGYRLYVVTNQPDVARKMLAPTVLDEMTRRILSVLPVERVLACIHDDTDQCACRKPKPGLLQQVSVLDRVDLSKSFMIGDSWKDMEAGRNAGCTNILIQHDYNRGISADHLVSNLSEAVDLVLGGRI